MQYFVYQFTGTNIFPIPRMSGEAQEEVLLNYMGGEYTGGIFRITSLSMEPKNLAFYLATGIIFLLELRRSLSRSILGQTSDIAALILMGSCLLLTYSTLGLVMIIAYFAMTLLDKKRFILLGLTLLIASIPLMFTDIGNQVIDIINDRVFNRIESSGFLEDFDQGAWNLFSDNPVLILTGVGLGNTHTVADAYLPYFAQWVSGNRWHAKWGGYIF